jgi:hypothetical protein
MSTFTRKGPMSGCTLPEKATVGIRPLPGNRKGGISVDSSGEEFPNGLAMNAGKHYPFPESLFRPW